MRPTARCLLLLYLSAGLSGGQEPLSSASAIRTLSMDQASEQPQVQLEATVSFYHRDWGVMFVHDGKEGICVGVPEAQRLGLEAGPGTRVRIEGTVGPGEFLPMVTLSGLTVLGSGDPPAYVATRAEDLFVPTIDSHPVEVEAVVKGTSFSEGSLVVDLQVEGHPVRAILPHDDAQTQPPWALVERRVHVRGVAGTHFNDQRQMSGRLLFVQSLAAFRVDDESRPAPEVPLLAVDGLLRVDSPTHQRVRVRGHATHVVPGRGLYLRGDGGSLFVQTAQKLTVQRDAEVEAEGYPVVTAFRPSLSAINVTPLGTGRAMEPLAFDPAAKRNSRDQCELVTLEAELVEITPTRQDYLLTCRASGHVFEAELALPDSPKEELTPGMKLRLTGICELESTHPLVIPRNANTFRLHLRAPDDITILARQPWWSERRARLLLSGLGALALIVGVWAGSLQWLVHRQSRLIRHQTEQQATLEERQRIARELHDTLEQELVGVSMLLDNTARRMPNTESAASESLAVARRLLRRAREESRSTIRELRSVTLEQRGLPAAMEELLRPLATAGGAAFEATTTGTPIRLDAMQGTHLLRLAQEAVANAARHAKASRIDLHLAYAADHVQLEVRDDGTGFDAADFPVKDGHFGLSGMKERTDKIKGTLRIDSRPGQGTTITIRTPVL